MSSEKIIIRSRIILHIKRCVTEPLFPKFFNMYSHTNYMDYLSDEQIKILMISKDSPHISNIVEQKDFMGKCQDRFIKNSSVFDHFSSFFSTFNSNSDEITSFEKTREIIKSELGFNGVDVLLSHEKSHMNP